MCFPLNLLPTFLLQNSTKLFSTQPHLYRCPDGEVFSVNGHKCGPESSSHTCQPSEIPPPENVPVRRKDPRWNWMEDGLRLPKIRLQIYIQNSSHPHLLKMCEITLCHRKYTLEFCSAKYLKQVQFNHCQWLVTGEPAGPFCSSASLGSSHRAALPMGKLLLSPSPPPPSSHE